MFLDILFFFCSTVYDTNQTNPMTLFCRNIFSCFSSFVINFCVHFVRKYLAVFIRINRKKLYAIKKKIKKTIKSILLELPDLDDASK